MIRETGCVLGQLTVPMSGPRGSRVGRGRMAQVLERQGLGGGAHGSRPAGRQRALLAALYGPRSRAASFPAAVRASACSGPGTGPLQAQCCMPTSVSRSLPASFAQADSESLDGTGKQVKHYERHPAIADVQVHRSIDGETNGIRRQARPGGRLLIRLASPLPVIGGRSRGVSGRASSLVCSNC